jgi:hypothetical protein
MLVVARGEVGLPGRIAAREDLIHVVPIAVRPVVLRSWRWTDIDEDLAVLREVDAFDRSKDTILEDGVQASHRSYLQRPDSPRDRMILVFDFDEVRVRVVGSVIARL